MKRTSRDFARETISIVLRPDLLDPTFAGLVLNVLYKEMLSMQEIPRRHQGLLAITHVTVVPMDTERLLLDQTVIIKDGIIQSLTPTLDPRDLKDIEVVDGSGKYLMPGIADMHVHYRHWLPYEFALYLANGVTLGRNMWGEAWHIRLAHKIQQGRLPGPHLVTTSPIIDGLGSWGGPVWPGSIVLSSPGGADTLVRRYAKQGYQQIKVYSQLTRATLQALGAASQRAGLPMVGHCPHGVTYEQAIEAGMSCFEHLMGIADGHLCVDQAPGSWINLWDVQSMHMLAQAIDQRTLRQLAQKLAREQIWNCPTLVVWQQGAQAPLVAQADPLLRYEPLHGWKPPSSQQEWLEATQIRNKIFLEIVTLLHEEGAPLLLGTDASNPFVFPGFSIHQELANLVHAGLTPYEALCCGTREAARFLGQSDTWGTIAVNKRADVLLLSANPLDDVGALRQLQMVFCNGYIFPRSQLDELLKQRTRTVDALPPPHFLRKTATVLKWLTS